MDLVESIDNLLTAVILLKVIIWLFAIAIIGLILFFVIRAICNYQARRNAAEFDYDYLAERTAEEVCKRMVIIEKQKVSAYNGTTKCDTNQTDPEFDDDQRK